MLTVNTIGTPARPGSIFVTREEDKQRNLPLIFLYYSIALIQPSNCLFYDHFCKITLADDVDFVQQKAPYN